MIPKIKDTSKIFLAPKEINRFSLIKGKDGNFPTHTYSLVFDAPTHDTYFIQISMCVGTVNYKSGYNLLSQDMDNTNDNSSKKNSEVTTILQEEAITSTSNFKILALSNKSSNTNSQNNDSKNQYFISITGLQGNLYQSCKYINSKDNSNTNNTSNKRNKNITCENNHNSEIVYQISYYTANSNNLLEIKPGDDGIVNYSDSRIDDKTINISLFWEALQLFTYNNSVNYPAEYYGLYTFDNDVANIQSMCYISSLPLAFKLKKTYTDITNASSSSNTLTYDYKINLKNSNEKLYFNILAKDLNNNMFYLYKSISIDIHNGEIQDEYYYLKRGLPFIIIIILCIILYWVYKKLLITRHALVSEVQDTNKNQDNDVVKVKEEIRKLPIVVSQNDNNISNSNNNDSGINNNSNNIDVVLNSEGSSLRN